MPVFPMRWVVFPFVLGIAAPGLSAEKLPGVSDYERLTERFEASNDEPPEEAVHRLRAVWIELKRPRELLHEQSARIDLPPDGRARANQYRVLVLYLSVMTAHRMLLHDPTAPDCEAIAREALVYAEAVRTGLPLSGLENGAIDFLSGQLAAAHEGLQSVCPVVEAPPPPVDPQPDITAGSETPEGDESTWAWVSGGVAGVTLATGLVFNVLARADLEDRDSQYSAYLSAPEVDNALDHARHARGLEDSARERATVSYVLFGVGALAVGATLWLVLDGGETASASVEAAAGTAGWGIRW